MKKTVVDSTLGKIELDAAGSPVAVAKLDPQQAYLGVPVLLQKFINENDTAAWGEIVKKIDYIYSSVDDIMSRLETEAGFKNKIQADVKTGKRLFFKPNVVSPLMLNPVTHGPGIADSACTEWTVIAALMRWFHDKVEVPYNMMAIGEAASALSQVTDGFNRAGYGKEKKITTEAVLEGKSGDFYGGWQFYFVRRYLQDKHPSTHKDNPMNGHEESVDGKYLPPGEAGNRLMVYDINRIEFPDKGREIPVPDGINFQRITVHKALIGGDPSDPDDRKKYPGSVLINVPKLKIHSQDLMTNALKNLGIGLYPMEYPRVGGKNECDWAYSSHCTPSPTLKSEIPHTPLIPEMDDRTILPLKNEDGSIKLKRTGGMPGTQVDIIRAVQKAGIFGIHFSEAIEATNINHTGTGLGVKIPEGMMFASLDGVALDSLASRFMYKTVPMAEAREIKEKQKLPGEFMHRVPVACADGKNIVTGEDVDSPLFRYGLYEYAEKRGAGHRQYYVIGRDAVTGNLLASLQGHLGSIENGQFKELMTTNMYYGANCFIWDMQKTCFTYLKANDTLFNTKLYEQALMDYDENNDGQIDYNENGRQGFWTPMMRMAGYITYIREAVKYGTFLSPFIMFSYIMRFSEKKWNTQAHDFVKDYRFTMMLATAFNLSRTPAEIPDPFAPGMVWGKGKWPSWMLVKNVSNMGTVYGPAFPGKIDLMSMYGFAFQYADKKYNDGKYTGKNDMMSEPQSLQNYFVDLKQGVKPLDFTFYVAPGFGKMGPVPVPNVIETEDPVKIFSADFSQGKEIWTSDLNIQ